MVPLLEIRPLTPTVPDLSAVQALAFTSRNGVETFARICPDRGLPVFTVGGTTAMAAVAAGFAEVQSADGALPDLAGLLARAGPRNGLVLAPGALETAGDLAGLLRGTIEVRSLAVYEAVEVAVRVPMDFDAVLVHSPRAADVLCRALEPGGGQGRLAVAISAAAARVLPSAGFSTISIAARPTDESLFEALGKVAPGV